MNETRTPLERISLAVAGSGSQDWVGALAMAQRSAGCASDKQLRGIVGPGAGSQAVVSRIGEHLTRLQTEGNQLSYEQTRASIAILAGRIAQVRRWRLVPREIERVAESALLLHIHPKCTTCHGRKYEAIASTPSLSRIECPACGGTGNRPLPRRNRDEVSYVLNVLAAIQGLTERAVSRMIG